ncbi:hypothetical protein B0G83_10455 [Paraburkholderia sp. BL21I4N1]|nr:hypothetical protein B0G83_10455 [Paraburkholderia sp. BL21I4N1]
MMHAVIEIGTHVFFAALGFAALFAVSAVAVGLRGMRRGH